MELYFYHINCLKKFVLFLIQYHIEVIMTTRLLQLSIAYAENSIQIDSWKNLFMMVKQRVLRKCESYIS